MNIRRFFIAIVLFLIGITIQAQDGQWQVIHKDADELTGEKENNVFIYNDSKMGSLVIWDWNTFQFRLCTDDGIFNYTGGSYLGCTVLVGLYDDEGKMKKKITMWLDLDRMANGRYIRTRDAGTMSNPVGQKGKVKDIFDYLQHGSGYVRFVAERYNNTKFDLIVPVYKEE